MLTQIDARRRITLPTDSGIKPGDTLQVEILEDGRIMLIPVEAVPRHQLWAWTTKNKEAISHSPRFDRWVSQIPPDPPLSKGGN